MPSVASAMTFQIDFLNGTQATFDAPAAGGLISGLVMTLGGITYDREAPGFTPPSYDPVFNDFSDPGPGVTFSYWGSSVSDPTCPTPLCVVEFEDRNDDLVPPVWAANTVPFSTALGSGYYEITPVEGGGNGNGGGMSPVPVPAGVLLLASGLAGLGALRLGRRAR
jgi:hypothetical protein